MPTATKLSLKDAPVGSYVVSSVCSFDGCEVKKDNLAHEGYEQWWAVEPNENIEVKVEAGEGITIRSSYRDDPLVVEVKGVLYSLVPSSGLSDCELQEVTCQ